VASRGCGSRNRRLGRSGKPPAEHYDLAARSSLHGSGGNAGDGSGDPRPKIATVERREANRPYWQVWYIALRSRPVRYIIFGDKPPWTLIQLRTCWG
jgi:hypothetical protein